MSGAVHVKDGSTWKCLNFSSQKIWVNDGGTWKEPSAVYVKDSAAWKKVYPSDLEGWTTANTCSSSVSQSSSNQPQLVSNAITSGGIVEWSGRQAGTSVGEYVRAYDFGWSPVTDAGFSYGAITRLEITVKARYTGTAPSTYVKIGVSPQQTSNTPSDYELSSALTLVNTTFTFDLTVAGWGLSDADAGDLHLDPTSNNSLQLVPAYNTTGWDVTVKADTFKARIKYKYN